MGRASYTTRQSRLAAKFGDASFVGINVLRNGMECLGDGAELGVPVASVVDFPCRAEGA